MRAGRAPRATTGSCLDCSEPARCKLRCIRCHDRYRNRFRDNANRILSICLHCGAGRKSSRAGLCLPCFRVKEIRERYQAQHVWDLRPPTQLPSPTDTYPGSEARIRVLEDRLDKGLILFHPGDLTLATADDEAIAPPPPYEET